MKQKLVSYDIWDTVLRRRCHPDAVKLHVAQYAIRSFGSRIKTFLQDPWLLLHLRQMEERKIGQEAQALGLDDEYKLDLVIQRWVMQFVADDTDIGAVVANLKAREILFEKHVIYGDPFFPDHVKLDGASRRIFISDFYMDLPVMLELLEHVGLRQHFDAGYVSCDIGLNKRSGRLFQHVIDKEGVSAEDLHHHGDNEYSDVAVPTRIGMRATYYAPPDEHRSRLEREGRFHGRLLPALKTPEAGEIHKLASDTMILFIAFIIFVQEQVIEKKLDRVYFCTREGQFFFDLYKILREASVDRSRLPEGSLLEVSRISTFSPSLRDISTPQLMRLWNLYSTQAPRALLRSLELPEEDFAEYFHRFDLPLDVPIQYPWQDARVQALLDHTEFRDKALAVFSSRRKTFQKYCAQQDLTPGTGRCAIVDIGWRGTIQDNIAAVFPEVHFHGCYLALAKVLNEQPPNVTKASFGPNLNTEADSHFRSLLDFVAPIEMLTNAPGGSVGGYSRTSNGAVAIRLEDPAEDKVFHAFTQHYQRHVIDATRALSKHLNVDTFSSSELRIGAMQAWHKLLNDPHPALAKAYFSLSHNESFGVGGFVSKAERLDTLWPIRLFLLPGYRARFRAQLSRLGWTAGYAKAHGDRLLLPLTRMLLKKRR